MANDDLILVLDDDSDLVLALDDNADMILVDDVPHAEHYDEYDGRYEVTPVLYVNQVLGTNNKLMRNNVTVKPIPVVITSNPYNGKTVVIG